MELKRYIKRETERELWARSAGRCEISGCNKPLYSSPLTHEQVNIGEMAHIYSFAERGPRGRSKIAATNEAVNSIGNLILVCHDCHKTIDADVGGIKYSDSLLQEWKRQHEERIAIVTGIDVAKKSHVVLYGANIDKQSSPLHAGTAMDALFPDWYPARERPIELSMRWVGEDNQQDYWALELANLKRRFERDVEPLIMEANPLHFSVFGLAPIPLLISLGALLTDKVPAQVYQLHREPTTWRWLEASDDLGFRLERPDSTSGAPCLAVAISASVGDERITPEVADASIWRLCVNSPGNDIVRSQLHLAAFRTCFRNAIASIASAHGNESTLKIFPAIPVSCAVEMGRARMPKADSAWTIYDQNQKLGGFVKTLTIR